MTEILEKLPKASDEDWRLTRLPKLLKWLGQNGNHIESATDSNHPRIAAILARERIEGCDYLVIIDGKVAAQYSTAATLQLVTDGQAVPSLQNAGAQNAGAQNAGAQNTGAQNTGAQNSGAIASLIPHRDKIPCLKLNGTARPIQILHLADSAHTRLQIDCAPSSHNEIVETFVNLGNLDSVPIGSGTIGGDAGLESLQNGENSIGNWHNHQTEIVIQDSASLISFHQQPSHAATFATRAVTATIATRGKWQASELLLRRASSLVASVASAATRTGSGNVEGFSRSDFLVRLAGSHAQFTLDALVMTGDREQAVLATKVIHAVPHCHSQQRIKLLARDHSNAVMQGLILVEHHAQKTEAHLLARGLILPNAATLSTIPQIDLKPELVIHADDVKCSHGATVGQLQRDALFYLQTRGISAAEAQQILIQAFLDNGLASLEQFSLATIADHAHKSVMRAIQESPTKPATSAKN